MVLRSVVVCKWVDKLVSVGMDYDDALGQAIEYAELEGYDIDDMGE